MTASTWIDTPVLRAEITTAAPRSVATAALFPGQGSQTADMRTIVEEHSPELIALAVHHVGVDPLASASDEPWLLQPAIFCASLVGWSRLREEGTEPDYLAGHSLGEIAALVAGGSLSTGEGMRLVAARARLMDWAAKRAARGGMLAVLGGDIPSVTALAEAAGVAVANDNCPGQVVLSGASERLDRATKDARASGLKAIRLPVHGAFHSDAMEVIVPAFERVLATIDFAEPHTPVFSSVTARPFDDIPRRLVDGLTHSVRWRDTLLTLHELGVDHFVEVGPGKVLTGLVRRTLDGVEARVVGKAIGGARV